MRIDHVALLAENLEGMRVFYETYFSAKSNRMYHNPRTGLKTYFLSFDGGARLELMTRPGLDRGGAPHSAGYAHLAVSLGSRQAVDDLTRRLEQDGHIVSSRPRVTGDGFYESCVLDPEGNPIELTV